MMRQRKVTLAKALVLMGVVPVLLWAYEYGPDPGFVGVPGENGGQTCANSGCHEGTTNNPANKGSIAVTFPNGTTYVPGVKQHLIVTISDPATTQKAWGFQLTARLAATPSSMAGSLAPTDFSTQQTPPAFSTQLMCSQPNLFVFKLASTSTPATCPSGYTLIYIEHSLAGFTDSANAGNNGGSYSYAFDWTPPATNVGNVTIYVAGNAGVGLPASKTGDHIYQRTYTLTPAVAPPTPKITSGGVVNGASFQAGVVPNSWITIQGTNLASTTDTWDKAIVAGKLPTTLDGVSVSVGGQPAYVYFISPTQINVVAPNAGLGPMAVTVTNTGSQSAAESATAANAQPAFFLWANKYPVATRQDGTWAVKDQTFPGTTTIAAKPGDVIILWGTGFGPTKPVAPVGVQTPSDQFYNTATPVSVQIGSQPASVIYALLAPGFAGLYQMAITVPSTLADGDYPLVATVAGASSPSTTLFTVKK